MPSAVDYKRNTWISDEKRVENGDPIRCARTIHASMGGPRGRVRLGAEKLLQLVPAGLQRQEALVYMALVHHWIFLQNPRKSQKTFCLWVITCQHCQTTRLQVIIKLKLLTLLFFNARNNHIFENIYGVQLKWKITGARSVPWKSEGQGRVSQGWLIWWLIIWVRAADCLTLLSNLTSGLWP